MYQKTIQYTYVNVLMKLGIYSYPTYLTFTFLSSGVWIYDNKVITKKFQ
jgi:hypothetical protein